MEWFRLGVWVEGGLLLALVLLAFWRRRRPPYNPLHEISAVSDSWKADRIKMRRSE